MSKPLMNHEIESLKSLADDVDEITDQMSLRAALARLDYLERKVQAAKRLADEVHVYLDADGAMAEDGMRNLTTAYNEVQP